MCRHWGCRSQFQTLWSSQQSEDKQQPRSSKHTTIDALKTGFWDDRPEETAMKLPWRETLTPKQTGSIRGQSGWNSSGLGAALVKHRGQRGRGSWVTEQKAHKGCWHLSQWPAEITARTDPETVKQNDKRLSSQLDAVGSDHSAMSYLRCEPVLSLWIKW